MSKPMVTFTMTYPSIMCGYLKKKYGKKGKKTGSKIIGRMFFSNPNDMERFCLRLLLINTTGATSFEYLRTYKNILYCSYKEACVERGLLTDDKTWTLKEAAFVETNINNFRLLFAMILVNCTHTNPGKLWKYHEATFCEDILKTERIKRNNNHLKLNDDMKNLLSPILLKRYTS